jgi:heme-binding protein
MTTVLQQPAGPQSADSLKGYFTANPKAALDLQTIAQPLTGLSTQCRLPISLPQVLGFMQGAQGGLPGGLPNAAAQAISGAQGGVAAAPGAAVMPGLSAIK